MLFCSNLVHRYRTTKDLTITFIFIFGRVFILSYVPYSNFYRYTCSVDFLIKILNSVFCSLFPELWLLFFIRFFFFFFFFFLPFYHRLSVISSPILSSTELN